MNMEEDNSRIASRDGVDASGSSYNPLKRLKKKINKFKLGSRGSLRRSLRVKEGEDDASESGSQPSLYSPVSDDTRNSNQLYHQESFQSTGTATSLLTRDLDDSGVLSSFDQGEHNDSVSDFVLASEQDLSLITAPGDFLTEETSPEKELSDSANVTAEMCGSMSLELTLISGCDLAAKDRNGFSDPYIKVKYQGKTAYKTKVINKSLNPVWDETFTLVVEDAQLPVNIRVFDHDTFSDDDFLGKASVDVTQLETDRPSDLTLSLLPDDDGADSGDQSLELGQVHLRYILHTQNDQVVNPITNRDKSLMSNIIRQDGEGNSASMSEWDYIVRIVLLEGNNLLSMDDNGLSDPYVRFKLQHEKYKTKFKNKTLNPKWMEPFSLHLFDNKSWDLDIRVFDHNIAGRADFMGRTNLDLSSLQVDKTHDLVVNLEDEAGSLRLLVTITGAVSSTDHEVSSSTRDGITRRYGLLNSLREFKDVGWLQLKVIRAHDLSSKDWDGKSDPFCSVELVNTMLQSHTSYNTLNPEWNRVFTIPVKDIHSVLEVTVYDEDKDMKKEFIGKVAIPLIMIENGVQKWYGLKDRKLFNRVKGEVLLELDMVFNHVKAAVRTFNPREEPVLQEEPKFKISLTSKDECVEIHGSSFTGIIIFGSVIILLYQIFKRNVNRVRAIGSSILSVKSFWQSLIDWDYPSKTITAFIAFMVAVWNFELYMLPLSLIILFMWNLVVREIKGNSGEDMVQFETDIDDEDVDVDEEEDEKESKRSVREYIDTVKSICCTIQEILGKIANLGEAVKNSVNWTVPWLSTLAVVALSVIMLILYMIQFRYIVLLWGINKFTKKLRKPNYIPNNEVLDYLSRVPSDVEKMMYKEIRADPDRGRSNSPQIRGKKNAKAK